MPTEVATYLNELDPLEPTDAAGPVGEGDDHLRLIKDVLQNTFPNITGAMTETHTILNGIDGRMTTVETDLNTAEADIDAIEADYALGSRTLTAGDGISGGGDLTSDRSFALDINGLTGATIVGADSIAFYDASAGGVRKETITDLNGVLAHDSLSGFVANEHVNHGSVSITAGAGLTGGGTIAASRTINVGAGNGITANTNDVAMSGSYSGTFTATEIQATSDRRLKTEIASIENALELVRAMGGRRYWRTDLEQHQFGVIAQDHARVQPEAVSEDEISGYLAVSYNQIVPVLIEAVKALAHRVEGLEQES